MKKALLVLLLFLPVFVFSQETNIFYKDNATLEWDAIATDENEVPLAPTDVVSYDIFLYDSDLNIDDQVLENIDFLGSSSTLDFVIDFTDYARAFYWAGVRTSITREDTTVVLSDIAWSYDGGATNDAPFGYIRLTGVLKVKAPPNFRDSGM